MKLELAEKYVGKNVIFSSNILKDCETLDEIQNMLKSSPERFSKNAISYFGSSGYYFNNVTLVSVSPSGLSKVVFEAINSLGEEFFMGYLTLDSSCIDV